MRRCNECGHEIASGDPYWLIPSLGTLCDPCERSRRKTDAQPINGTSNLPDDPAFWASNTHARAREIARRVWTALDVVVTEAVANGANLHEMECQVAESAYRYASQNLFGETDEQDEHPRVARPADGR